MNQKYNYDGNDVTFYFGNGDVMINATEMARPFGKRAGEWLRLPSTMNFLSALEPMGKSHRSELVATENGIGTWMHEDVALEFARWLSPMFAIWCNDRIKELVKFGFTATDSKSDLAKILTQKGVELGQNRLFKILRSRGYLLSKGDYWNQPSQKAMEQGLFQIKKQTILKPDGSTLTTSTPMVTGRGQVYFINKFLKENFITV